MIAHTYADWLRCITVDCGIKLAPEYIAERLRELSDENTPKQPNSSACTGSSTRKMWYAGLHRHEQTS